MSVTIFLSYADLGFLGAGMKYAAESYSRGDRLSEVKVVGFSHFILFVFVLLLASVFLYLSFKPHLLIKGINNPEQGYISSSLLLILAIFSPTIIVQRVLQMIFGVRLQDYILQRINIGGNLIKIASVFYFFGNGRYEIIAYFLFIQIINVVCAVIGVLQAKKLYKYDFILLLKNFRFNPKVFNKTKALAFSSLFVTISWILYYELDAFAIGNILGAREVAIYAIGFTVLSFFRSLLGTLFSPFAARFNHFTGAGQIEELKQFYRHVLKITLPLVIFPIVAVLLFARPLVISWVGVNYEESIDIVRLLVLCNLFAFISYPAGMLMIAQNRLKEMYLVSLLMPLVYWLGIVFTVGSMGLKAFAIFKFVIFALSGLIYLRISLKFIGVSWFEFFRKNIVPYLPGLIIMSVLLFFFNDSFINGKSTMNLLSNGLIVAAGILLAMGLSVITVNTLREYVKKIFNFHGAK